MSEDIIKRNRVLGGILKVEAVLGLIFGALMLGKHDYTDWVFINAQTDKQLGFALLFMGVTSFFIAKLFFKTETVK